MITRKDLEDRQTELRKEIGSSDLKGENRKAVIKELETIKELLEFEKNLSWDQNPDIIIENIIQDFHKETDIVKEKLNAVKNSKDVFDKRKVEELKEELKEIESDILSKINKMLDTQKEIEKLQKKKIRVQKNIDKEANNIIDDIINQQELFLSNSIILENKLAITSSFIKKPIIEASKSTVDPSLKPMDDKTYMFYKLLVSKNGKRKAKEEIKRLGYDVSGL